MRRALLLVVLALTAAALVFELVNPASPPPPILDDETLVDEAIAIADPPATIDELKQRVASVLQREQVPGVGLAIVGRDGPIWVGGVGVADPVTRTPVTERTVFRIASITKSFIGLGVMRLVEQGKLDLDRPLRDYVPDAVDNPWERESPVTLAHVLEHTAGLDDMRFNEVFTGEEAMTPSAALEVNPRSRRIRWRPGTRHAYSNVGYTLAARAIEVATGEPFDRWLRREVLGPIGLPDADFQRSGSLGNRLAVAYDRPGEPARYQPIVHRAAGAILASPADLAAAVQFWLRRGDGYGVVSPAGIDRIERTGTLPYPPTDIAYGLGNYGDVRDPTRSRGHDGGLPGFWSALRYHPELGRGYVMLLPATFSRRAYLEVRALLYAFMAKGIAVDPEPVARVPSPPPEAAFYRFASPRHSILAFLETRLWGWHAQRAGDRVRLDPLSGDPIELVPARHGGFAFPGESGTSVQFTRNRDGVPIMHARGAYAEADDAGRSEAIDLVLTIGWWLLRLAPLWSLSVLGIAVWERRRPDGLRLTMCLLVAGLAASLLPRLWLEAAIDQRLGEVHPLTIAICATTVVYGLAAAAALIQSIRWAVCRDRPAWWRRALPTAMAIAVFGFAVWFAANGIIGLRTWSW